MKVNGRFWLEHADHTLAGPGRIELLERIRDTGSISEAARGMKMSYKAAWDTVDAINRTATTPVITRNKGGRAGGGSSLTAAGEMLIATFRQMEADYAAFLLQMNDRYGPQLSAALLVESPDLETCIRPE